MSSSTASLYFFAWTSTSSTSLSASPSHQIQASEHRFLEKFHLDSKSYRVWRNCVEAVLRRLGSGRDANEKVGKPPPCALGTQPCQQGQLEPI
jgi:hypothetical protein